MREKGRGEARAVGRGGGEASVPRTQAHTQGTRYIHPAAERATGISTHLGTLRAYISYTVFVESGLSPFWTWRGMVARCHHPSNARYKDYGGRGIVVCARWRESYEAFVSDVGMKPSKAHSLDRIDNEGNYEPGNVRWATASEQAANKRPVEGTVKRDKTFLVRCSAEELARWKSEALAKGRGFSEWVRSRLDGVVREVPLTDHQREGLKVSGDAARNFTKSHHPSCNCDVCRVKK